MHVMRQQILDGRRTFALLIGLCLSANCAAVEELNIKGVQIGMTQAEVKQQIGGAWECYEISEAVRKKNDMPPADPDRPKECGHPINLQQRRDTYAGFPSDIDYFFKEDKLVKVYVQNLTPQNFNTIEGALIGKFGKPDKRDDTTLQNAFGAKFDNVSLEWRRSGSILRFDKQFPDIEHATIEMVSESFELDEIKRSASKARSDM